MTAPLLFDELLDRLRHEGFSVGTDQYLRMHALFERHANASPDELRTLLCPIFAMSAGEQERFHVAYNEFFAAQAVPRQTIARRVTVVGQKLPELPNARPAIRWRLLAAIIAPIAVVLAAVVFWPYGGRPARTDRASRPVVTQTVTENPAGQDARPDAGGTPAVRPPWVMFAALLTLGLFGAEVARTVLRWMRQREHRAKGRPFDWPVRDPHPTAPRLFADQRFFGAARLMKGREVGDVRRLDVPRSILATIRSLGDPVFEYKLDRRVTEYLFLVERRSDRDHLAAYVHAMLDALVRDGVLVEVFEHDGDPRICWKPGSSTRIATADLYSRFPQHRLVIVGNAVALTDPVTGEALDSIPRLFPWNCRAILTPEDETRGLSRFGAYFDVYALANNGLPRLAERWQQSDAPPQRRRVKERRRNLADLPSSPDELERELEPLLFRWLLRCAVHPSLHWDLTRELAPPLPAAEHETALLDLARLEWFRRGRIPEPERLALVSRLAEDEPEEHAARASAMRVLAAAPPPPPGSMAARVFEIQQLAHRIWGARDRPSELRPLMRRLRHFPPSQVARDGALMMLLQEAPGTLVTHALPQPLRRFLFREGIPAFGMKNFVALAAMLPVMLFAGNAVWQPVDGGRLTVDGISSGSRQPSAATPPTPLPPSHSTTQEPPHPTAPIPTETVTTATTATVTPTTATSLVATTEPPAVEPPRPPTETPRTPVLPDLPTLISPAAGTVITIAKPTDVVTFTWKPAGAYTLQVLGSNGTPLHVAKVRGTSASWRVKSASANTWSLMTQDGRVTDRIPFDVEYEVLFTPDAPVRTFRSIEASLPVNCATTEGRRDVDLKLSERETFERAELKVLNPEAFTVADLTPYDQASFSYRFVAAQPCLENTLFARVRVTATIRLPQLK